MSVVGVQSRKHLLLASISPFDPGCAETCTRRERAELFSLFSSSDGDWQIASFLIQRNRDKLSTRKFDVGVFTQPGSKTEVPLLPRQVRSTLRSRRRQITRACPKRAMTGNTQHEQKRKGTTINKNLRVAPLRW